MPAGVRVEPVVKADAYGHGLLPVAVALERAGADGLCVATLDEALAVREAAVAAPVRVLYPVPPDLATVAAAARVDLAAGDPVLLERTLEAWSRAVRAGQARGALRLHLEIETGLGRGGVPPDLVARLVDRIATAPRTELAGLWSHLQAPEDAAISARQVGTFEAAVLRLPSHDRGLHRDLAASGGLLAESAPAYDAVRLGLSVYGLIPDELDAATAGAEPARSLRPALSLYARSVRVLDLPAGTGISYGPTFVTARPSRIATLPLGYGDGWPRALSNRSEALVRGNRVPLVGNVAMDAVMADVTDVPGAPVGIDDEFVLIGRQGANELPVRDVARLRNTNAWEVVTTLSARLTRVYTAAAEPVCIRSLAGGRGVWRESSSGTGTSATSRSMRS